MKRNTKIEIKIQITETEEAISQSPVSFEDGTTTFVVRPDVTCSIDDLEKDMLNIGYHAIRNSLSQELSKSSKKKANEILEEGQELFQRKKDFSVEGESGRFEIKVYDIKTSQGKILTNPLFVMQQGKNGYITEGYKEIVLFSGVCDLSYRKVASDFSRRCYQETSVPYRTLQNQLKIEGRQIENMIQTKSEIILEANGFSTEGIPIDCKELISKGIIRQEEDTISHALKQLKEEIKDTSLANDVFAKFK